MQSKLDPGRIYPLEEGVAAHDLNYESDMWTYDGREVYRGSRDPRFENVDAYWLYDEDLNRVGLAEHDGDRAQVLWVYECPFATFLQEDDWTGGDETVWSMMPQHVYEYCMDHNIHTVDQLRVFCQRGNTRIVTLRDLERKTQTYGPLMTLLCVDSNGVLYRPPAESRLWVTLHGGDATQAPPRPPPSAQAEEPPAEQEPYPGHPGTPTP